LHDSELRNVKHVEGPENSSLDIGLEVGLLTGTEQPLVSRCLGRDSKQSTSEETLLASLFGPDFSVIFLGVWGNSGIKESLLFPH